MYKVRRDEPQTRAVGLPRVRDDGIEQRRSDSLARLQAVERHDLAGVADDVQGEQADNYIPFARDKAGEFVRTIYDAVRDDDLCTPTLGHECADAVSVGAEERTDEEIWS